MQGADEVVMAFLRLVIDRRSFLHQHSQTRWIQDIAFTEGNDVFHEVQQITAITICHGLEGRTGIVIQRQGDL